MLWGNAYVLAGIALLVVTLVTGFRLRQRGAADEVSPASRCPPRSPPADKDQGRACRQACPPVDNSKERDARTGPGGLRGQRATIDAMASINEEVAALLREYAELLGLTGGDPFRSRNYEKAAKSVGGYPDDIGAIPDAALTRIPGVGSSIAAKIAEYRRTGTIKVVDELRAKVPPGALLLSKVPGVGPKRALQIAGELGVTSVGELGEAVRNGRLRGVAGFGPKSEERILRGIAVAVSDAALRDALRSLPADATEDDIYAVLAAHVGSTARTPASGAGHHSFGRRTCAGTCTRTPTSPTASSPWRE